jgi:hypothetical protein
VNGTIKATAINLTGNVGIGITNPSTALHVNGTITATAINLTGATQGPQPYCIIGGNEPGGQQAYQATSGVLGATILVAYQHSSGMTNSGTNGWNTSNGRFYPTIAGKWQISWNFCWRYIYTGVNVYITRYNSSNVMQEQRFGYQTSVNMFDGTGTYYSYSTLIYCNTGDYLVLNYESDNEYNISMMYYQLFNTYASFTYIM